MKAKRLDNQLRKKGISDDRLYFHRYNLSNEEYHKITQAVSSSALKDLYETKNPAYCHAKYIERSIPHKQTPAMSFGSAVHSFILERRSFKKEFVVWDGGRKAGNEWKFFKANNENKTILTMEDYDNIRRLRDAVYRNPEAAKLLAGGEAERSCIFRDEETGVLCRARTDYIKETGGSRILVDLKTTLCAEPTKFTRDLIKLNYPIQQMLYMDAFKADAFAFIAVEKGDFNTVQVYDLDDAFDHCGHMIYRQTLEKWAKHVKTNNWPPYREGIHTLEAPEWWQNKILYGEQ